VHEYRDRVKITAMDSRSAAVPAAVRRASAPAAPRARRPRRQPARCRRYTPCARG